MRAELFGSPPRCQSIHFLHPYTPPSLLILPSYVPNRVSPVLKTLQFLSSFCRVYLLHPLSHHSPLPNHAFWSLGSTAAVLMLNPGFLSSPSRAPLGMVRPTFFLLKTLLPSPLVDCRDSPQIIAHLRFLGFFSPVLSSHWLVHVPIWLTISCTLSPPASPWSSSNSCTAASAHRGPSSSLFLSTLLYHTSRSVF